MPSGPLGLTATHGQETWANFVLERLTVTSALIRGGARFVRIDGRVAHIPRILSDGSASWVAELAEIPSSAPTGDDLVLTPMKLANTVVLSSESISDSPVGELDQVGLALARSIATAIDARIFSTAVATAVAPAGLLASIPLAVGPISIDSIIRAIGVAEAVGGIASTVWINPQDLTDLRLVKTAPTGSNQPVLQPDLQEPGAVRIGGALLVSTPALPVATAIVGDASQIVIGVRHDVQVEFSAHARFTSDGTVARVTARAAWGINDSRGLVKIAAA
ncbi:MAG: phage major capsid protein [Solirubrobacteraceae bacterium]